MSESIYRRARRAVVEALYEADTSNHDPEVALHQRLEAAAEEDERLREKKPARFALTALRGIMAEREALDRRIGGAASQHPVETLAVIDRNVLRLAIWELLSDNSAPVGAVVNEAVELVRLYGGETSPGFVNGVLRTISEQILAERQVTEGSPEIR